VEHLPLHLLLFLRLLLVLVTVVLRYGGKSV
jgi:hypothetical protein